jgi:replicative DNA helicase
VEAKRTTAQPTAQVRTMPQNRMMPHNLEAEQSVLGCMLIDNDATIAPFSGLSEADFYSPVHKIIYNAMRVLVEKQTPVDFVTLSARLSSTGVMDNVGGIDYLTTLNDIVPSSANLRHYIEILKKFSVFRKLIAVSNQIIEQSYSGEDEKTTLANAEKLIFDISREGENKDITPLGAEIPAVLERLDIIAKDPTAVRGLYSGFYSLDNLTNGFQKGDLIILAARPSVGKTSLGLNMVLNAALKKQAKCAIFSLEMSKRQLATRALCSVAKVSLTKALKGDLSPEEWARIWIASDELSKAEIYVDDNSVIKPHEISSKCMRLKREKGLDLVMIDYLGLMTGAAGSKRESRQVEVADNSRAMKILAKELETPVILLSQLNRGIEGRKGPDGKPVLSDLRESGAIEQDADLVMFIHREKDGTEGEYGGSSDDDNYELIVAKHRQGPLDNIPLRWLGEFTTFVNMPNEQKALEAREKIRPAEKAPAPTPKKLPKVEEGTIVPLDESSASDIF